MKNNWSEKATNIIKAELARKGMTYNQLQIQLTEHGVNETANAINVKINRGTFSFIFFLQVMAVIGAETLHLDEC